jgi:hypothetical protein
MICEFSYIHILLRREVKPGPLGNVCANVKGRYPPKMIPGCDVIIHTTATTDRDARLLLSSIGIPFHGKLVD